MRQFDIHRLSFPKLAFLLSERNLFIAAAFLNLLPVFLVRYVGSLDGPQHLYLSKVIGELWMGNSLYADFYQFGSPVIGNITGNLFLAFFNLLLPAWLAEKMLLTAILLGMAFSFRYLVIQLSGRSSLISFLIFPFSYHMFFMQGYYNFSLAYVFLFTTTAWWIAIKDHLNLNRLILLTGLFLLTYYTHIFVFGLLLLLLAVIAGSNLVGALSMKAEKHKALKLFFKQHFLLLATALPGIILGFFYWQIIPESQLNPSAKYELVEGLSRMQLLIGYITAIEMVYTRLIGLIVAVLIFYAVVRKINMFLFSKLEVGFWQKKSGPILLTALMLLFAVLFFSDLLSAASMQPRLMLSFLLFIIVWLAALSWPKWVQIVTLIAVVLLSVQLRWQQHGVRKQLDIDIVELLEMENYLPAESVVLSLNFSSNWVHHHFKNYLGSNKAIINLHTDAVAPQFVVDWSREKMPDLFIGEQAVQRFNDYSKPFVSDTVIIAKYIAVWGFKTFSRENFDDLFKQSISENYESLYITSKGNGALFRFKE